MAVPWSASRHGWSSNARPFSQRRHSLLTRNRQHVAKTRNNMGACEEDQSMCGQGNCLPIGEPRFGWVHNIKLGNIIPAYPQWLRWETCDTDTVELRLEARTCSRWDWCYLVTRWAWDGGEAILMEEPMLTVELVRSSRPQVTFTQLWWQQQINNNNQQTFKGKLLLFNIGCKTTRISATTWIGK